jgi:hypothetical protein
LNEFPSLSVAESLGGHVRERPDSSAGASQIGVGDPYAGPKSTKQAKPSPGKQDVGRFDVTVDHLDTVGGIQCRGDLAHNRWTQSSEVVAGVGN